MTLYGLTIIELNGRAYWEGDRGRFDAVLVDNGEEIAHTEGDKVVMYSGIWEDVALWAESFGIAEIETK